MRITKKDGSIFPVEIVINHIQFGDKEYHCVFARDITERKKADIERLANLKHFESMDKVNRAIQGAQDLDNMINDVLDVALNLFDCDRAQLQFPCDPEAESWTAPMIRTKPEYPRILKPGILLPMDTAIANILRIILDSNGPVKFGYGAVHQLPVHIIENFKLKSTIVTAIYPKIGKPWLFGLQQCSYDRKLTFIY